MTTLDLLGDGPGGDLLDGVPGFEGPEAPVDEHVCPICVPEVRFEGSTWRLLKGFHMSRRHGWEPKGRRTKKPGAEQQPQAPGAAPPATPERKPERPKPRRVDASDMLGRAWGWVGEKVEAYVMLPTGRAMQLEADIAGVVLADTIRDTPLDRPVQWAARKEQGARQSGAVLAFPVLVHMGAVNPAALPKLEPFIVDALIAMGPAAAKAAKRRERKAKDLNDALQGWAEVFGKAPGEPVTRDDLMGFLYPPLEPPPPPDGTIPARVIG